MANYKLKEIQSAFAPITQKRQWLVVQCTAIIIDEDKVSHALHQPAYPTTKYTAPDEIVARIPFEIDLGRDYKFDLLVLQQEIQRDGDRIFIGWLHARTAEAELNSGLSPYANLTFGLPYRFEGERS